MLAAFHSSIPVILIALIVAFSFIGLLVLLTANKRTRRWGGWLAAGVLFLGGSAVALTSARMESSERATREQEVAFDQVRHAQALRRAQSFLEQANTFERMASDSLRSAEIVEADPDKTILQFKGRPDEYIKSLRDQAAKYQKEAESLRQRAKMGPTHSTKAFNDFKTAFDELTKPQIKLDGDEADEVKDVPEPSVPLPTLIGKNGYADFYDEREGNAVAVSNGTRSEVYPLEREVPAWFDESPNAESLGAHYDYQLVSSSPNGTRGCLAYQKLHVLGVLCDYVQRRSKSAFKPDISQLGMSTAEVFDRFVRECRFVHNKERRGYSVYTLVAINNESGGDELVAKTMARVRADRLEAVISAAVAVLVAVAILYLVLRLTTSVKRANVFPQPEVA